MKDIKTYIIGFLSATCLFLFIGATDSKEENSLGKYQLSTCTFSDYIFQTIIDTETGEVISQKSLKRVQSKLSKVRFEDFKK